MRQRALWPIVAALLAASAPILGGPSSQVAWTLQTVRLVRSGDATRGQKLHKDCADCHGPAGSVETPDVPDLAGQNPLYLYKQLQDYKTNSRTSSIMNDAVSALSDRDMADLAAFYAAQKPPRGRPGLPEPKPAAAKLASVGDGPRLIPACDACHGDRGAGNPGFYGMPWLRNQKFDDLNVQLLAFRSGERHNDVYRVMRDVARRLSDAEVAALVAYYAGTLPSPGLGSSAGQPAESPGEIEKK